MQISILLLCNFYNLVNIRIYMVPTDINAEAAVRLFIVKTEVYANIT